MARNEKDIKVLGPRFFHSKFGEYITRISKRDFVLDVGTSRKFNKGLLQYRSYFNSNYKTLGYIENRGNSNFHADFYGDLMNLDFEDESIDAIICLSVIEHLPDPLKGASEIYRVLKKGGLLLLTVPFMTGWHGKQSAVDSYSDFWRPTHQGLAYAFR